MAERRDYYIDSEPHGPPRPCPEGFPEFLWNGKPVNIPQRLALLGETNGDAKREWKMRSRDEWTQTESMAAIMARYDGAEHPSQPVSVRQAAPKGQAGTLELAKYDNWAAFQAGHDLAKYPVKLTRTVEGVTVVVVVPKPWAGKPAKDKGNNDSYPPTRRTLNAELMAQIVGAAPGSRGEIQKRLVALGVDKVMLDNSLGGKLDRLAREGALVKVKEGGKVAYNLPIGAVTPAAVEPPAPTPEPPPAAAGPTKPKGKGKPVAKGKGKTAKKKATK